MKTTKIFALLSIFLMIALTSCGDDDEPQEVIKPSAEVILEFKCDQNSTYYNGIFYMMHVENDYTKAQFSLKNLSVHNLGNSTQFDVSKTVFAIDDEKSSEFTGISCTSSTKLGEHKINFCSVILTPDIWYATYSIPYILVEDFSPYANLGEKEGTIIITPTISSVSPSIIQ